MKISIQYDQELETKVREGTADPLAWITSIRADEEYLIGDDDDGMKEYIISFLTGFLQSTKRVVDGDSTVFQTGNGPIYIAFEPKENDLVSISICYSHESAQSPSERKPYEPQIFVTEDELVNESLRVSDEYYSFVEDINPELATHKSYLGLLEDQSNLRGQAN